MAQGFYHPLNGYFESNADVPDGIRAGFAKGTVEVPLRPIGNFDWDGSKWVELPPDPEALAAEARSKRDSKLAATDWMALSDVTMSPEWATYRQALRDVTDQVGFPENVNWPVKP
jgi:hypothetical protein